MKSFSLSLLLAFIAGGLYALTYPATWMPGWFPLLFISLPLFLWLLERATSFKRILATILFYNIGLNVVGFYWVPHTLREFGQLPWIVSVILGLLFSLILQPHWWLYTLWKKFRPDFNWRSEKGVLITALLMTLMERYFPQQFPTYVGSPWLHLAPYVGTVPFLGVVTLSFMTFWLSQEVVTQIEMKKLRPQVFVVFTLFIILNAVFPVKTPESGKSINVRVVQANVGNFLKVASERGDSNSFESINRDYFELSTKDNGFKPDLIIWPETAYSSSFYSYTSQIPQIFMNITEKTGAEMLIGGYVQDSSKDMFDMIESVFNASVLMNGTKIKSSYHKNILIPFGETLPFGPFNRQIVSIVPAVSLFARGEGTPLMETQKGFRFVTPICYEILETNYMRGLLNQHGGNRFIVNHTNDSWYGDTAEPHQHLFLSKWRALEFQLPIVRSTNTGITSVIFPDGSESKRLGVGEKNILDVTVPLGTGEATFYQAWGVWPLLLLAAILLGITALREIKKMSN